MIKASLASFSDGKKLLVVFLFALLSVLIFSFLGSVLVVGIYGTEGLNWLSTMAVSAESIGTLKVMQIMQTIGMFVFPGFLLAYLFSMEPSKYIGLNKFSHKGLMLVIATMVFALPGINFLGSLNEQIPLAQWMIDMELKAEELTKAFLTTNSLSVLLINLFMVAVLPAIGEELIFRGLIQKHLANITKSQIWGIIISALIFSAFHLQFKGFIPRFALGVMFGLIYSWSGSLWLPIIAHFVNNSIATVGYMMLGTGALDSTVEDVGGLSYLWPIGLMSIAIVAILLMKLKEMSTEIRRPNIDGGM